jgi:hypothetical protein
MLKCVIVHMMEYIYEKSFVYFIFITCLSTGMMDMFSKKSTGLPYDLAPSGG